jgi:hypothetical protein
MTELSDKLTDEERTAIREAMDDPLGDQLVEHLRLRREDPYVDSEEGRRKQRREVRRMSETRVIKVAVLVTAETRPKDISRALDATFEEWPEVLQFVVEGYGWDGSDAGATEEALMAATVEATVENW